MLLSVRYSGNQSIKTHREFKITFVCTDFHLSNMHITILMAGLELTDYLLCLPGFCAERGCLERVTLYTVSN